MIISLKSRIYHLYTGEWNERIGGRRVGAGRDFTRAVFPYTPLPIDFHAHSLASPLSSFRSSRSPSYSCRRRDAENRPRQISRTFPKCAFDIPSPGLYSAALFRRSRRFTGPRKYTKYRRKLDIICFFFCFSFSLFLPFFCFKYY